MATTTTRRRTASQQKPLAAVPSPAPPETPAAPVSSEETPKPALAAVPAETPKAKPEPKPAATVDLGERKVSYYFPTATLADGTTVQCLHVRYGHESPESARRCISALVASKGHKAG